MKVVLLYQVLPDYRQQVLELLIENFGEDFHVFTGLEHFQPTTKTGVRLGSHMSLVNNHFFLGRRILIQTGMFLPVSKADVAILELNPRILSVWLLLIARKILRKKSVLWGHAWPKKGRNYKTDRVRNLLRELGDIIVVYTETQAQELKEKMPNKRIIAAPNALYSKSIMGADEARSKPTNFIYVGRLVPFKKPLLLFEAFASAVDKLPKDCNLVFVGEGPLRVDLETRSQELGLGSRIEFKGPIFDFAKLRKLYAESLASVSPGAVGLSITQSFAFGVPMIVARDEVLHGPEIEAAMEGANSLMFASDSRSALSNALLRLSDDRELWIRRRVSIASWCAEHYSVETMANRMAQAVDDLCLNI